MSAGDSDTIKRDIIDLEFWNTDQSVIPVQMTRGMKARDASGIWRYVQVSASGNLLTSNGLDLGVYDHISVSATSASDLYEFSFAGVVTRNLAVYYTTSAKDVLSAVNRT